MIWGSPVQNEIAQISHRQYNLIGPLLGLNWMVHASILSQSLALKSLIITLLLVVNMVN